PVDDILALLVERVQQLAVEGRPARGVRGAQVHVRVALGADGVVRQERVRSEIAEPHARLPWTGHGRDAELPRVLDRPVDTKAAVDLARIACAAARIDGV